MLISLNWLQKYIDLSDIGIKDLEHSLTMIGQEVEKIEFQGKNLENVVTAKIISYEKHPDSDHLTKCMVQAGDTTYQIVCGAKNHKEGDIVALAKIGAKLDENFEIKKTKIRGVESFGMLCSFKELNLGDDDKGIIIFPEDTPLNVSLKDLFNKNDIIFELEITPNRPDCLSHIGIARELSCYYKKDLKYPEHEIKEEIKEDVDIEILDDSSNRYTTRIIRDVEVKSSPSWLKEYLTSVGIRSINNLVDISNFVMLEYNQPIHIFDLDKIDKKIKVKKVSGKVIALDGKEYDLKDDIAILDSQKIVAIAGVMGLENSEVDENTKNILIEVAHFDKNSIRATSKRLNLSSEASYRFERGVDTNNLELVSKRVAYLVKELASGKISNISDKYVNKYKPIISKFDYSRFEKFVGQPIPKYNILDIFKRLEIKVDEDLLTPPSFRLDLQNQFDYFEEVIRMYGFDNIKNVLPSMPVNTDFRNDIKEILKIKDMLSNMGLREVINYSFIPKNSFINTEIDVINPITEDFVSMRSSLMYSLLKNVKDNLNRSETDIKFFEVSKVFSLSDKESLVNIDEKGILENTNIGIIITGNYTKQIGSSEYNYYTLKNILENVLNKLHVYRYKEERSDNELLHKYRSSKIHVNNNVLAQIGEVSPNILSSFGINKKVYYCEISYTKLKEYAKNEYKYSSVSIYPSVSRDMALLLDKDIYAKDIVDTVYSIPNVEKVTVFDEYYGLELGPNMKSIAINVVIRDKNKTLVEEDILKIISQIEEKLSKKYQVKIR